MGNDSSRLSEPRSDAKRCCPFESATAEYSEQVSKAIYKWEGRENEQKADGGRKNSLIESINGDSNIDNFEDDNDSSSSPSPTMASDNIQYGTENYQEESLVGHLQRQLVLERAEMKLRANPVENSTSGTRISDGAAASWVPFKHVSYSPSETGTTDDDQKDSAGSDSEKSSEPEEGEIRDEDDESSGEDENDEYFSELDSDNESVATTCNSENSDNLYITTGEGDDPPALRHFSSRKVLESGTVIGDGGFGRVLQGKLPRGTAVAIKLFHAPLAITSELSRVLTVDHRNILPVFGVVYQPGEIQSPQLVLQYCSEGNVLQYLSRTDIAEDISTLGKIALDVAEGCEYLHRRGIVHGNLAARNVLVAKMATKKKTYYNAKISDVGLIRFAEVFGGNYMKIPDSNRVVPIRWVPREIIAGHDDGSIGTDFTFASDVWSYGVFLWEIWTRGAIPYGAGYTNMRVLKFLKDGYSPLKLHRPKECPAKVVSVMESIFQVDPNTRPSFSELREPFKKYRCFGQEHRSKDGSGSPSSEGSTSTGSGKNCKQSNFLGKTDTKKSEGTTVAPPRKRSNKKCKNLLMSNASNDIPPTSRSKSTAEGACCVQAEVAGAAALPPQTGGGASRSRQRKEKRRGGFGRQSRGSRGTHWPNRSGRNSNGRGDGRRDYGGGEGTSVQARPSLLAPPPYTEEPLPHHTTSRFSAPLPEYEYGPAPLIGSRGGGGREGYSGSVGFSNRSVAQERPHTPEVVEENLMKKIKRIAQEMEALRTERTMQELIRKSAELADAMKLVTTRRTQASNRSAQQFSPSVCHFSGGDQYYTDNDFNGGVRGGRSARARNDLDFQHSHQPHRGHSRQYHRGDDNR